MRRSEKEITSFEEIEAILKRNTICRIALSEKDVPYIVPMNYGYTSNTLILHSAPKGKKLDIIAKNNQVCFEVTDSAELIPAEKACEFTTQYRSVIGFGTITRISGSDEKKEALKILMKQHSGTEEWTFSETEMKKITVLKIAIDSMTGKSGY